MSSDQVQEYNQNFLEKILGKIVVRDILEDVPITWDDIENYE